jgi:hypothetical protein
MPFNNKDEWYLTHYNISCKKFVQNACEGYLCYNDLTYDVSNQKAVLKLTAAMKFKPDTIFNQNAPF